VVGQAVSRGSWSERIVIQIVPGKAEACPRSRLLGHADNAAGGDLGAKIAAEDPRDAA